MTRERTLKRNRLLNRPIDPGWMAVSLGLANTGAAGPNGRELLDIALRDENIADGARAKLVETLHPVWINPPPETSALIGWARTRAVELADQRPLHLLALMATYPFFADLLGAVGRLLRSDGEVDAAHVRSRLTARWGDRDAVNVAQRKCILTLRWFGVLSGERGSGISRGGDHFAMVDEWALFTVAALLLGRDVDLIDGGTVETAPELFFLDIRVPSAAVHPLLERITSGDRRTTYALRRGDA